jgi:hypothetical protein
MVLIIAWIIGLAIYLIGFFMEKTFEGRVDMGKSLRFFGFGISGIIVPAITLFHFFGY